MLIIQNSNDGGLGVVSYGFWSVGMVSGHGKEHVFPLRILSRGLWFLEAQKSDQRRIFLISGAE